jgi:NitT/TauT family transport system substrate-binding protein
MVTRHALLRAGGAVGVAALAGCSSSPRRTTNHSSTSVTYLTGFQDTPREQYARVAGAKGFFTAAGLRVTIQPGQPADFNFAQVAAGHAQFASVDFVSAVRGAGRFPYRVVAAVQQSTLLGLAALASRNITTPVDLLGRTIGSAAGGAVETLFPLYARLARIDASRVRFVSGAPDLLPTLLGAGKVDLVGTYLVDVPSTEAAVGGRAVTTLGYERYLTDLYGTVLIADSGLVRRDPSLVREFAAALMRGTVYATDHPDEAGEIIKRAVPTTNAAAAAGVFRLMKPYVGAGTVAPGSLTPARVMRGVAILESGGIVPAGATNPDRLVAFNLVPGGAS